MAVTLGEKLVPDESAVPPEASAYQKTVPALAVAEIVTTPEPHRVAGVVEVMVGTSVIVAVTGTLGDSQSPNRLAAAET